MATPFIVGMMVMAYQIQPKIVLRAISMKHLQQFKAFKLKCIGALEVINLVATLQLRPRIS